MEEARRLSARRHPDSSFQVPVACTSQTALTRARLVQHRCDEEIRVMPPTSIGTATVLAASKDDYRP